jgi:hypothetical protein
MPDVSGTRFQFTVIGEGKVRARGELAFVLPQALDLVSRTAYVAGISEADPTPPGVLRLWSDRDSIQALYTINPNRPNTSSSPAWLASVPNLSRALGRTVTWQTAT